MMPRSCFMLMVIFLTVGVLVCGSSRLNADEPGNTSMVDRLYIFSLKLDAVSVDISEGQVYRKDLATLYENFKVEGNKIKSDTHWKKQVQDILIWELNKYGQFFAKADDSTGDYIPIGLNISFSPMPEGDLLAVVSNITIYLENNPVYRCSGKAYLMPSYPPYGSPFLQAVKVAFDKFDSQALCQQLEKYRYFVPVLTLDERNFSQKTGKEPSLDSILARRDEIKEYLEKKFNIKLEQSIKSFKKDLDSFRQIIFSVKNNLVTKDDLNKLMKENPLVNDWIAKLRKSDVCLVLDSGYERDPDITTVTVRLPDGEEADFNVVPNCDKDSPSAVWLKCTKKNNTYIVKEENRQLLTAIKIRGLKELSEILIGRVIAR